MDLRQLEYFTAIVREGSLTAAARACRVAQPSLSQQLRSLEERLRELEERTKNEERKNKENT